MVQEVGANGRCPYKSVKKWQKSTIFCRGL